MKFYRWSQCLSRDLALHMMCSTRVAGRSLQCRYTLCWDGQNWQQRTSHSSRPYALAVRGQFWPSPAFADHSWRCACGRARTARHSYSRGSNKDGLKVHWGKNWSCCLVLSTSNLSMIFEIYIETAMPGLVPSPYYLRWPSYVAKQHYTCFSHRLTQDSHPAILTRKCIQTNSIEH